MPRGGHKLDDLNLTLKQRRFVEAYLGECAGNGVESAKKAGYKGSYHSLGKQAFDNLKNTKIIKAIRALELRGNQKKKKKRPFDRKRRLEILEEIAETGKHSDRVKALDVANKMDGLYVQRIEMTAHVRNMSDEQLIVEIQRLELEEAKVEEGDSDE